MSSSTPSPRFLIDENVRVELARWLRSVGCDVKLAPRSTPDRHIAALSKSEKRIMVTNDDDFCSFGTETLVGLVWLRIPQNNPKALVASFRKWLAEATTFSGRLVVLQVGRWTDEPLGEWVEVRPKTK